MRWWRRRGARRLDRVGPATSFVCGSGAWSSVAAAQADRSGAPELELVRHLANKVVLAECDLDEAMLCAYRGGATVAEIARWTSRLKPAQVKTRIADWAQWRVP